jgi:hypothetical protein
VYFPGLRCLSPERPIETRHRRSLHAIAIGVSLSAGGAEKHFSPAPPL